MSKQQRPKGNLGPQTEAGRARAIANLIPAKPGEVRNPGGRKTGGASIREWLNVFAEQELTESDLRAVARDPKLPWPKRAAAERIIRTLEAGDLAAFSPLLHGEKTLDELRAAGLNTEVVKKLKYTKNGLEIELHDRAGADFDRISDRTDGKPKQAIDVNERRTITPQEGAAELTAIVQRLRERLGPQRNRRPPARGRLAKPHRNRALTCAASQDTWRLVSLNARLVRN